MSFFGKSFKKVDTENVAEIVEKLNLPEKAMELLIQSEAVTTFEKNEDGKLKYTISSDGNTILSLDLSLDEEIEVPLPDGGTGKLITTTDEETSIKTELTLPDGNVVSFERTFDGDNMTMEIVIPGIDLKGIVHYEAQ